MRSFRKTFGKEKTKLDDNILRKALERIATGAVIDERKRKTGNFIDKLGSRESGSMHECGR